MEFRIDRPSFCLGMIEAFSEVVMQEVKDLAFGPPMEEELWLLIKEEAEGVFDKFGLGYYEERHLINTDLAPREAIAGKLVPIIYLKEDVFDQYLALKHQVEKLEEAGDYDSLEQLEASIALRRLLSYSEEAIKALKPASYAF